MSKERMTIVPTPEIEYQGRFSKPGHICLANEERYSSTHFSEPLTGYASDWTNRAGILALLRFLAAEVECPEFFEYRRGENAEWFLTETDDVRAIGAPFKRVDYSGEMEQSRALNKGLVSRFDPDGAESKESVVSRMLNRLVRNDLRRAVNALSAAAGNTAKTWAGAVDPDGDLGDLVISAEAASGCCNRLLLGEEAFRYRAAALRGQDHAGRASSASISLGQLALNLGVSEVQVGRGYYQADASTKTRIVPSIALAFYGDPEPTPNDPSNCKRFVVPLDGQLFRVYEEPIGGGKMIDIIVEHRSRLVVVSTTGLMKLTVSGS